MSEPSLSSDIYLSYEIPLERLLMSETFLQTTDELKSIALVAQSASTYDNCLTPMDKAAYVRRAFAPMSKSSVLNVLDKAMVKASEGALGIQRCAQCPNAHSYFVIARGFNVNWLHGFRALGAFFTHFSQKDVREQCEHILGTCEDDPGDFMEMNLNCLVCLHCRVAPKH